MNVQNEAPISGTEGKKRSATLIRWAISILILVFLFTQVDILKIGRLLADANLWILAFGLFLTLLDQVAVAVSWQVMLAAKGFEAPVLTVLRIALASNFLGFALPSTAGSDVVKVVGLSRYIGSATDALTSLFLLRALGYAILFLIALLTIIFFSDRLPDKPVIAVIKIFLIVFFVASLAGLFFTRPFLKVLNILLRKVKLPGLYLKVEKCYDAFMFYLKHPKAMGAAIVGTFIIQFNKLLVVYVASLALDIPLDPVTVCVFVPIITAAMMMPVSISGIGVSEGGYVLLFGYAGLSMDQALGLSLSVLALNLTFVPICGAVYWKFGFPNRESLDKLTSETQL